MKAICLVLVLTATCIMPSQSQVGYVEVSYALNNTSGRYNTSISPIFVDEDTSPICINQTIISNINNLNYYISVKNTGETKLINVILSNILAPDLIYNDSFTVDPYESLYPIEEISNKDDTTKILRWNLGELQTGEVKDIILQVWRSKSNDHSNDEKNSVEVRAWAPIAAGCISRIHTNYTEPVANGNETTYEILVENAGETRLTDVILNDTLPAGMHYLRSKCFNKSGGEVHLKRPTIIISSDGTTKISWFLGDFETDAQKTVELNVSCIDESCSLGDNKVEASGWTSIVNKIEIPILITSPTFSMGIQDGNAKPAENNSVGVKEGPTAVVHTTPHEVVNESAVAS